jgi:type I restriction enzyme S subunit
MIGLRANKNKISYKYLFAVLRSNEIQKKIENNHVGLVIPHLRKQDLPTILIPVGDDKDYDEKIGTFYISLSKKIEINNRINAELEAMAKTLYDYWFVQFDFPDKNGKPYKSSGGKMVWNKELKREIPAGWEVKKLGVTLKTSLGGTPSTHNRTFWENGTHHWLNSGEVAEFPVVTSELKITDEAIKKSATDLLPKRTCLLSITRHIRPTILAIDACVNQSVVGIKESCDIKCCYIYPYLKNELPRFMQLRTGAQQPHINKEIVDDSTIVLPNQQSKVLANYNQQAEPLYKQIINNAFQNQHLSSLRDWLLPMLMNGQVTVS